MNITEEMASVIDTINNTNDCVFVTGKAGTGKTMLLKYIASHCKKKLVVTAPTGISAVNAEGATLHSTFDIPIGFNSPKSEMKGSFTSGRAKVLKSVELIIIDEISMVRPDTIDYIDRKLKLAKMSDEPFGGVQVVMFGDLYQLPPVITKSEKDIVLSFYRGFYFFYANVWKKGSFKVVELTEVFRQNDRKFVRILNNIRKYNVYSRDLEELDEARDLKKSKLYNGEAVHICPLVREADRINDIMIGECTNKFKAEVSGNFKYIAPPCENDLKLKVGARVMTTVNDKDKRFYNGSLGIVKQISENYVLVEFDDGSLANVERYEWTIKEYVLEKNEIVEKERGKCVQFPIRLAWAITIHKSQGLTFDKVVVHTKNTFGSGMLYVALSRCRSLKGITTDSFIDGRMIVPDKQLIAFDKAVEANGGIFNYDTYKNMNLR